MSPFFGFVKVVSRSSYNDVYLIIDVVLDNLQKPHKFGLAVRYGNHVYAVSTLQLSVFEKEIENRLRIIVLSHSYNRSHARSVRFIRDIGYTCESLFVFFLKVGDLFKKLRLVYLIRKFCYDYVFLFALAFLYADFGSEGYLPFTRFVSVAKFAAGNDISARREIRSFNDLHHLVERNLRVVKISNHAVDNFR